MFTKAFWAGTFERALKTFAQSLVAALSVGTGLLHVDWTTALDVAAGATVLSVLTSLATVTTVVATAPPAPPAAAPTDPSPLSAGIPPQGPPPAIS